MSFIYPLSLSVYIYLRLSFNFTSRFYYIFLTLSIYLSICLSVCLSVGRPVGLSVCMTVYFSISMYLSISHLKVSSVDCWICSEPKEVVDAMEWFWCCAIREGLDSLQFYSNRNLWTGRGGDPVPSCKQTKLLNIGIWKTDNIIYVMTINVYGIVYT